MFGYYVKLALLSFRRNWILSSLMVAAIGLGIGASMTTLTVNYLMSSNPIPQKSDVLFHVQVDSWDPNNPFNEPNEPPDQVTFTEASNFYNDKRAFRQTANSRTGMVIEPQDKDVKPFIARLRLNTADFFPMFDVPFIYGSSWNRETDISGEQVIVISKALNEKLFGGRDSVGEVLVMDGQHFNIVGVLNDWRPLPKFFDVTTGAFDEMEDAYIPFFLKEKLKLDNGGNTNCWKPSGGDTFEAFLRSECVNYQYWVELPTEGDKDAYATYLENYVTEQKELGRFPREMNNRLSNVVEWMENQEVVADDAQMMMYLAFMFLLVCLLNTIGLLLAKFMGKAGEIGLRRAIGAGKSDLFYQYLIESAVVGVAGGLLGLLMTWFGLQGLSGLYGDYLKGLVELDWVMVLSAILLAIVSSVAAGLYPTWRACSVAPAAQLKSQ